MTSDTGTLSGGSRDGRAGKREPLPYGQTYRMLDYSFRVEWDDPHVGEILADSLGWFRRDEKATLPTYTLKHSPSDATMLGYLNGRRFHGATSPGGWSTGSCGG